MAAWINADKSADWSKFGRKTCSSTLNDCLGNKSKARFGLSTHNTHLWPIVHQALNLDCLMSMRLHVFIIPVCFIVIKKNSNCKPSVLVTCEMERKKYISITATRLKNSFSAPQSGRYKCLEIDYQAME